MRVIVPVPAEEPTEIDGHSTPAPDKFVRTPRINGKRISFGDLARFACPYKTEAWLAHVTGYDARTCRRWLGEHNEPPAEAFGAVMFEIMRRYQMRVSE